MSVRIRYVLSGEAARAPERAGAKAAALAGLAGEFAVPEFFVITAEAFSAGGLKPAARSQALTALAQLGSGPFAVRSSAREEDGAAHAHAGQYDTVLGVGADDVIAAAERVWRSGFSDSLAHYRAAKGLSGHGRPPAVIIQRLIEPRAAGVAFSACPLSGDRDCAVINAVAGRGDRLVSGEVDGECVRVSRGGDVRRESTGGVLSDADCRAVADLARACAAQRGAPQDIEWAFDGAALYLLQSRPITTLADADAAVKILDNSNIVESYPGVVAPLTYSFARYAYAHVYRSFARLMGVSAALVDVHDAVFAEMLEREDGRVYYNLLNWYRALALFPGFKANRAFMEQMMGVAEALPAELAARIAPAARSVWARALDQMRFVRVTIGLVAHALMVERTSARFRERINLALATPDFEIDAMSAAELAAEYRQLEDLLLTRWDAPLINDFLCMIAFGASRKALEDWAGAGGLALHGDVMIGQGDIISAEPARRIREMGALARLHPDIVERLAVGERSAISDDAALAMAFAAYLEKFGDRCVQELKLESVSLHEEPRQLLLAIASAARAPMQEQGGPRLETGSQLRALFKGRPLRRVMADALLRWARARVRDRENLRFERTRLFGRVRRIFRAMGARFQHSGVLIDAREVFYLHVDEILGAAEDGRGLDGLGPLARVRRAEDAASALRPDPPERISSAARGGAVARAPAAEQSGELRHGLACCAGQATARVRVILDPREEALQPGEILVARSTDPGWIAVFANAAGIIAERGSLLSHSAIVAREMGVPCVVALKGATDWLRTGDVVRLDGATGSVERVRP